MTWKLRPVARVFRGFIFFGGGGGLCAFLSNNNNPILKNYNLILFFTIINFVGCIYYIR